MCILGIFTTIGFALQCIGPPPFSPPQRGCAGTAPANHVFGKMAFRQDEHILEFARISEIIFFNGDRELYRVDYAAIQ